MLWKQGQQPTVNRLASVVLPPIGLTGQVELICIRFNLVDALSHPQWPECSVEAAQRLDTVTVAAFPGIRFPTALRFCASILSHLLVRYDTIPQTKGCLREPLLGRSEVG